MGYGLLILALLFVSGFFSGAETALMSLSGVRVRNMVGKGVPKAELVQALQKDPGRLLATLLIGNNVVNIASSSLTTLLFVGLLGGTYGAPVAVVVTTLLVLAVGEIIPKTWANAAPEKWALWAARPIRLCMTVFSPLAAAFAWLTRIALKAVGDGGKHSGLVTKDEIKTVISLGHTEGVLAPEERDMLASIFEFRDTLVREIMVPRVDMFALEQSLTAVEAAAAVVERRYSRVPVYAGSLDNIVGVIHTKDLLEKVLDDPGVPLKSIMRPVTFVPEGAAIAKLFQRMQGERVSLAVVLDEYGVTQGLVTIEDIVEEIVGEIIDEYDESHQAIQALDEEASLVEGSLAVEVVNRELGLSLPTNTADTVGGFVFCVLGRLPGVGDKIRHNGWELTVAEMERRRIKSVKLRRIGEDR